MKKIASLVLFAFSVATANSVLAADQGAYVGLGLGQAKHTPNSSDFDPTPLSYASRDTKVTAYKLFAGYQFNKYFGVEGAYTNLGKSQGTLNGRINGSAVSLHYDYEAYAVSLAAVGSLPIGGTGLSLIGKLGGTMNYANQLAKAEPSLSLVAPAYNGYPKEHTNKPDLFFGAGLKYAFSDAVGLRLEYENFGEFGGTGYTDTRRNKIDLLSVGVEYKF